MDDPWRNAWDEASTPTAPRPRDLETDIGITWSTGAHIKWDDIEPSSHVSSLWVQPTDAPKVWDSPYEHLPLEGIHVSQEQAHLPSPPASPKFERRATPPLATPPIEEEPAQDADPPRVASPAPSASPDSGSLRGISPARSASPDAFGGFESGLQHGIPADDSVSHLPDEVADAWGTSASWDDAKPSNEEEPEEASDEWEAARRRKEQQDRRLPPDLLPSLLRQFDELAAELWLAPPEPKESVSISDGAKELKDIDWLEAAVKRFSLPSGMTISPPVQLKDSHVGQKMAEALKLTRNFPMTQTSPLALLLASKGSLAWEASVKSKQDVVHDGSDLLPAGWKMADQEREKKESAAATGQDKPKKGGLLSFLGRRTAKPSGTEEKPEQLSTPSPVTAAATAPTAASETGNAKEPILTNIKSSPSHTTTLSVTPHRNMSPSASVSTSQLNIPAAAPTATPVVPNEPAAAPSAVSRFFGVFSRAKPAPAHSSLALTSDDLDFLSEVAAEEQKKGDADAQLLDLSDMIDSKPLPKKVPDPVVPLPKLAPPPPPGRKPTFSFRSSSGSVGSKGMSGDIDAAFASVGFGTLPERPASPSLDRLTDDIDFSPPNSTRSESFSAAEVSQATSQATMPTTFEMVPDPRPSTPMKPITAAPQAFRQTMRSSPARAASVTAIMSNSSPPRAPPSSNSFSQFTLPPPPSSSSRPHTPGMGHVPFTLPPPPAPSSRSQTPAASFSKSNNSSPLSALKAPQNNAGPTRLPQRLPPVLVPVAAVNLFDDDDFSDFHSSSATTSRPIDITASYSASSLTSPFRHGSPSTQALFEGLTPTKPLPIPVADDFDDFVSSPLRSPSPPRPPAKPVLLSRPLSSSPSSPSPPAVLPKSPPRPPALEHVRTQSLVEAAAERVGRWPTPPSPLPLPLPPPGGKPVVSDPFGLALWGGKDASVSSMVSEGAFTLPPPPNFSLGTPPPGRMNSPKKISAEKSSLFGDLGMGMVANGPSPKITTASTTTSSAGVQGGLSAQDLLFFEGL